MVRRLRVMGIPEGAVADDTDTNSRSLYICTYKCNRRSGHARYDICSIGLSDLSSILKSKSQLKTDKLELLRKLASVEGKDVPYSMGCCLFGSQILLAGGLKSYDPEQNTPFIQLDAGTQIYLFETDDDEKTKAKVYNHGNRFGSFPPPHSHSHSHGHGGGVIKGDCCYGELHQGKPQPLVVEVAGKLFVLSGGPVNFFSPTFEEFNSNKGTWTTLADPPYVWVVNVVTSLMQSWAPSAIFHIYAGSFFAIPLFRWFILLKTNADIEKRNQARQQCARALELPDLSLRRKLLSARDMAQRTFIGQDRIVYSTDRDPVEQDYEAQEWDKRFREIEKSD